MRIVAVLTVVMLLAFGVGCDWIAQKTLEPGVSTEADVRRLMGEPEMVWEENDGNRVLEYPRGPTGTETWMVAVAPNGTYRSMANVLGFEQFKKVSAGMHRDEVRRLLGKPTDIVFFQQSDQEVWSFKFVGQYGDKDNFHVHFNMAGRVLKTSVTRDPQFDNA